MEDKNAFSHTERSDGGGMCLITNVLNLTPTPLEPYNNPLYRTK